MNISNRLKIIASLVDKNEIVLDIGTDHALLPIYLVKNGITDKVIACDNKVEPLNQAKSNINKYNLNDNIEVLLSDGLDAVKSKKYSTITISGLGGDTMKYVLDFNYLDKSKTLILEPNSSQQIIRKHLLNNNFDIVDEIFIKDSNKYYQIIKAKYSDNITSYSEIELEFGRINIKNKTKEFTEFINSLIMNLDKALINAKDKTEILKRKSSLEELLK